MRFLFLVGEDPGEKEMSSHSSILAWENLLNRGAGWATVQMITNSQAQLSDGAQQCSPFYASKSQLWLVGKLFPVVQRVKNLPTMQETWVWPLGQEDPLEKGMAIHSNILAWRIPWTEEPGGLLCKGSQRVGHNWATNNTATTMACGQVKSTFIISCISNIVSIWVSWFSFRSY